MQVAVGELVSTFFLVVLIAIVLFVAYLLVKAYFMYRDFKDNLKHFDEINDYYY